MGAFPWRLRLVHNSTYGRPGPLWKGFRFCRHTQLILLCRSVPMGFRAPAYTAGMSHIDQTWPFPVLQANILPENPAEGRALDESMGIVLHGNLECEGKATCQ